MSRRTEMPYQADGAGQLAPHRHARCSTPEVNGAVAQVEFTFLLREICSPGLAATPGATSSNGRREGQKSAEAIVPGATSRGPKTGPWKRRDRTNSQLGKGRTWQAVATLDGLVPAMTPNGRVGSRANGAETECCDVLRDGQEPPDADPHVRWCGSRGEQSPRRPDWPVLRRACLQPTLQGPLRLA